MNKEKLQKFMNNVDITSKPKHWRKFINKNTINHNLILKCGNRAFCTHCQKYFDKSIKVDRYDKEKCKWCGNEYYIGGQNLRNFIFLKDVAFFTKVDNQIVLRIFEVESKYDYKTRKFKQDLQEFARVITPNMKIVINNTVSFYMWNQKIWHNLKIKKWHIYTGNKLLSKMPIYQYNENVLFKGTQFEYAPIKEFKEEYKFYDDIEILKLARYPSFELLWKMGLHKLSLKAECFNKKGNFVERFGIPKSFLKFMVENDINYDDYKILKLIQKTDIELIKKCRRYKYDYLDFMNNQGLIYEFDILNQFVNYLSELKTISKYVPIKKFINYEKGVKNINLYADYLEMADKLNYSIKSKKRLFPKQLKASHDKLAKKLDIIENMETNFGVYLRYLELSKYTFEDDKFIIYPAPTVEDIIEEGRQQNNCVASIYLKKYKNKETEIYFIREKKNLIKSLITLEYRDGKVKQKELANHKTDFTGSQIEFIDKWIKFKKIMENQTESKTKIVKYDFNKIVA